MNVLITGASGFLGSHVAEQLSLGGHSVRALVRRTSNRKFLESLSNVELVYGAVEEADKVEAAADGVDAIVHAAGIVKARNREEFHAINVGGTQNVIAAAKKQAGKIRRVVYVSSLEACGPSVNGDPIDADQQNPITAYGRSKLEAERAIQAVKDELPVVTLRPTGIYGPRDVEIFEVFKAVQRRVLPITGDGSAKVTFTYATDCAKAIIRAIEADIPSGRSYFITDGKIYVQREAMEEVERAIGKRAIIRKGLPLGVISAVALGVETYGKFANKAVMLTREKANMLAQPYWVCSTDNAMADLGWKPEVDWAEGTRRTVKWYRENGWL
ncbi:NAD-dependent epimerase/dehydratase family protein [Pendulispora albinea]|uniref:NAD-dependent epimerase/dehydratase family protein n=1 Tax=Pendulispora albinea TaxID=2741071 RepID=A0ABZ2LXB0_9BACT